MNRMLVVASLAALLLGACIVTPADRGARLVVPPPLPVIVEFDVEPFYYQSGYYYHYDNNRWRYSNSRSGPWTDLPRSHYPKETRYKGRGDGRGKDHDRDDRR
jgi:hypothetical protein